MSNVRSFSFYLLYEPGFIFKRSSEPIVVGIWIIMFSNVIYIKTLLTVLTK